ncbi:MAG: D-alanine--D-alanine ligase [Ginsengibacter sp.]
MKPKIAFVTGGYSGEAEISYKSALTIEKNIDPEKFDFYKIDLTPESWFYETPGGEKIEIDKNDFSLTIDNTRIKFDGVLIGIHGTPGEDGKLQGYLDILGIPYTSCDCAVSALTFNKRYTVAVAAFSGIHVANSVLLFKNRQESAYEEINKLQFPVFVKPNNGGSSLGISRVNKPGEELNKALEKAFKEDNQVLVEELIQGRELTIGVMKVKNKIIALPITEIITENEFFDFEAKYLGASKEITPAEIDRNVENLIKEEAKKIYTIFNCKGIIRIDFIYNEEKKKAFMLEINTVPGQTEASLVPQQLRSMGLKAMDVYTALIEDCLNP